MGGLQVAVEFVGGVAGPELGQRDGIRAFVRPAQEARIAGVIDVIAHEQHQIEVAGGDLAMHGEAALFVMLARRQRQAQPRRLAVCRWRGTGASDRTDRLATDESVVENAPRRQPIHRHPHAVRQARQGDHLARTQHLREGLVVRHFPAQSHRQRIHAASVGMRLGGQPGPQHDAARTWLAARDPERERVTIEVRCSRGQSHLRRAFGRPQSSDCQQHGGA